MATQIDDIDAHNMKMFNIAKAQLLNKLVKHGHISKEDAEEVNMGWQYVLYKPKWYERWAKLSNYKDKDMGDTHVKLVTFSEKDEALELIVKERSERGE